MASAGGGGGGGGARRFFGHRINYEKQAFWATAETLAAPTPNPWEGKKIPFPMTYTKPMDLTIIYTYANDDQEVVALSSPLPASIPISLFLMVCPRLADLVIADVCVAYGRSYTEEAFQAFLHPEHGDLRWANNGKFFFNVDQNPDKETMQFNAMRLAFVKPDPVPVTIHKVFQPQEYQDAMLQAAICAHDEEEAAGGGRRQQKKGRGGRKQQ